MTFDQKEGNSVYVFFDDQIFHAFHDEIRTLRHQFCEHVDSSRSTSGILARSGRNFTTRSVQGNKKD